MTAPVPDAEWLAPIVASLSRIEISLRMGIEVIDRLREDVVNVDKVMSRIEGELACVRGSVEGKQ